MLTAFFVRSKHFFDFLIFRGSEIKLAPILAAGWHVKTVSQNVHIISSIPPSLMCLKHGVVLGSGYAFLDNKMAYHYEEEFPSVWLHESVRGHYSTVIFLENSIKAKTDPAGQERLFYFLDDGIQIVTNRLHLAALVLRHWGKSRVNRFVLNQQLGFSSYITNSYFSSDQTIVDGVTMLPSSHELSIDAVGHVTIKRIVNQKSGHYKKLVADGADELIACLIGAANRRQYQLNIELSGGKDSRLTLAALLAGPPISCIRAKTYKTKAELDFPIAVAMLEYFKIAPSEPNKGLSIPLSIDIVEEVQRSLFLGVYFLRHDLKSASFGATDDEVFLTGLGGNIFRNGASETIISSLPNAIDLPPNDFANAFFDKFFLAPYFTDRGVKEQRDFWVDNFSQQFGETTGEKLTSFHKAYTVRAHGGIVSEYSAWAASLQLNVLVQAPSLYAAALLLTEEERTGGKLFVDAYDFLYPEVLRFPFDKSFPLADRVRKERSDEIFVGTDYDTKQYSAAVQAMARRNHGRFLKGYRVPQRESMHIRYTKQLDELFEKMLEVGALDESLIRHDKFKRHLDRIVERNPALASRYVAMLMSAADVAL